MAQGVCLFPASTTCFSENVTSCVTKLLQMESKAGTSAEYKKGAVEALDMYFVSLSPSFYLSASLSLCCPFFLL